MKRAACCSRLSALVLAGARPGSRRPRDDGDAEGKTYEIVFDNAFGVTEGGDFKVAGVRAGTTGELEVDAGGRVRSRW